MTLNVDGPHSPENTRRAAALAAEAIRFLNHATGNRDSEALRYPSDVDAVVQDLAVAVMRMPQLFGQIAQWLGRECDTGRLEVRYGPNAGHPQHAAAQVSALMVAAAEAADRLHTVLDAARQVTASIGAPYDASEDPDA